MTFSSRSAEPPLPTLRLSLRHFCRLVVLIRPHWGAITSSVLLGLLLTVCSLVPPYVTKLLFDEVYPTRNASLLELLVAASGALAVVLAMSGALRSYYSAVVGARLSAVMSLLFFNHVQHLPVGFYDGHRVGEILSRFQDLRSSLAAVSRVLAIVLSTGLHFALVPPLLLVIDWRLAMVALMPMPVTIGLTLYSARVLRQYHRRSAEVQAEFNALQVETLSHIRTIKSLVLERHMLARTRQATQSAMRLQLKATGLGLLFGVVTALVGAIGTAVFTWYSWGLILDDELTLGNLVAFTAYATFLFRPIHQWASLVTGFQQTSIQLARLFEYLDAAPEQDPDYVYEAQATRRVRPKGELSLARVSFAYVPGRPVLEDISFRLPAGSVTAVVGRSGAGKSSLVRLLCGIDRPQRGELRLDGRSFDSVPLHELRHHMGVVWQEAALFQGTLWDNITIGVPAPKREHVEEVLRVCQLEDTIARLPEGLNTKVAEWGASLSGGQRQRVAIARVLLRNTPVLLLDEATGNVDLATEAELLRQLLKHAQEVTIVMVTHRVSSASVADRICVLEQGRVVGFGTERELRSSCEIYRSLCESTVRGVGQPAELAPTLIAHR